MDAILPDGHGSVRLASVPEPVPAPDAALVAVEAYSVNRGETFLLESPRPGWRPGKDVAGGWAERVPVPTSALAALPGSIPTTTAAALPLAGLTALRLLRRIGSLLGRSLLVTGASGGVGHYLTEIAVGSGATVTAVTATDRRGERLRALGAHTVTDFASVTGPFDVGLESVGGASFTTLRRLVRPDGRIIWFGEASRTPVTIDFFDWVDGTAAAPIEQFDYTRGGADGPDLATLVALVAAGRLHPEIGGVRPWRQTADVIADLRGRRVRGNAVLTITDNRRAA
jgi:NADPH:quinone reductase